MVIDENVQIAAYCMISSTRKISLRRDWRPNLVIYVFIPLYSSLVTCVLTGADPYVIIYCEGKSVQSSIKNDTLQPEFKTSAIFYRKKPGKPITIEVGRHRIPMTETSLHLSVFLLTFQGGFSLGLSLCFFLRFGTVTLCRTNSWARWSCPGQWTTPAALRGFSWRNAVKRLKTCLVPSVWGSSPPLSWPPCDPSSGLSSAELCRQHVSCIKKGPNSAAAAAATHSVIIGWSITGTPCYIYVIIFKYLFIFL